MNLRQSVMAGWASVFPLQQFIEKFLMHTCSLLKIRKSCIKNMQILQNILLNMLYRTDLSQGHYLQFLFSFNSLNYFFIVVQLQWSHLFPLLSPSTPTPDPSSHSQPFLISYIWIQSKLAGYLVTGITLKDKQYRLQTRKMDPEFPAWCHILLSLSI